MQRPKLSGRDQPGELAAGDRAMTDAMIYDMQVMYKNKRQPS
jgi:hypothetical protein